MTKLSPDPDTRDLFAAAIDGRKDAMRDISSELGGRGGKEGALMVSIYGGGYTVEMYERRRKVV
jgi:hypothetical protein